VSGAWGRAPHSEHGNLAPTPPTIDTVTAALDVASDILTRLTGFSIHPALAVEEDFVASPRATRLVPSFSPVRALQSVIRVGPAPVELDPTDWALFGGAIYFSTYGSLTYSDWLYGWCDRRPADREFLRIAYHAGSTITASARQAVIALAHDIWLDGNGCDECGLPERTINVNREGISYNVGDPTDVTGTALTGLAAVDVWIKAVNPHQATRSGGVYTPDSPPPVVRSVKTARPEWGSTVHLFGNVTLNVTTARA